MAEKGEFEPFKMLIGAVFALLVLTIIISAINSFQQFREKVSLEKFYEGIRNAANQPNGHVLKVENVFFKDGTIFVANSIARQTGLKDKCVLLEADPFNPFFESDYDSITITFKTETNVFTQCYSNQIITGNPNTDCEIACRVSFGEPLNNDE